MHKLIALFFLCLTTLLGANPQTEPMVTLTGHVIDAKTKKPLPARVIITNPEGKVIETFFQFHPGLFTETDGSFKVNLVPGKYTVEATRGYDYLKSTQQIEILPGKNTDITLALKPWLDLRARGWYNGEAHAHLPSKKPWNADMIRRVHRISRAEGIDFVFANQGWAGYDEDRWELAERLGSDDDFRLFFGIEMPKQRWGHSWWLGLDNTCGYAHGSTDEGVHDLYRSDAATIDAEHFPYTRIPSFEIVSRYKLYKKALAVHAHPTWWEQGGKHNPHAFLPYMSAELAFDLLSGQIWDGMAVMGLEADNYYYQNLWFNVLNLGYRMTPFSELDGGFVDADPHYAGSMRTYYHVDGPLSVPALVDAGKKGHVFLTSGPLVFCTVDDKFQPGDIVPVDGNPHRMVIDAYASGQFDDYISFVVIFRNGKIFKIFDHRDKHLTHVTDLLDITETEKAWYVAKVYGSHTWGDISSLDVMDVTRRACADSRVVLPIKDSHEMAITSPFYFWPAGTEAPKALVSHVHLRLETSRGVLVPECDLRILLVGKEVARYHVKGGLISFDMPVNAWVEVILPDGIKVRRSLFSDYAPFTDILYNIISGKWMTEEDLKGHICPGRVPWWAFQFDESKKILSDPRWTIVTVPNERDPEWAIFDHLCGETTPIAPLGIAVKGRCVDIDSRVALPACIIVRDEKGNLLENGLKAGLGIPTELDGTFTLDLQPGKYTLEATHGFDYELGTVEIVVDAHKNAEVSIPLKRWVNLQERGWVEGNALTRLNETAIPDPKLVQAVHKLCRAQGLDFLTTAQNWAGYDEEHWPQAQELGSDGQFALLFGADMPSQRFGHTWWLGLDKIGGWVDATSDQGYEAYEHAPNPPLITPERFPFTAVPDVEIVPRFKASHKAFAVHAHPALWWWQHGKGQQFVSRLSADLVFSLLSGRLWDGMTILGYDHDVYLLQNLWFHVLNLGYRLPPFTEIGPTDFGHCCPGVGSIRTCYYLQGPFNNDSLVDAARRGHTFVTSGPLVFATVDDKYQVGDLVPIDDKKHRLNIEAYASGANHDPISYVVVFRNGKIFKIWDHRNEKPRKVVHTLDITESEKSWFVVKVHAGDEVLEPAQLETYEGPIAQNDDGLPKNRKHCRPFHQVAMTSPFYFWSHGTVEPKPLMSHVDLNVITSNGAPAQNASIRVLLLGEEIASYQANGGHASFDMPVNAWLEVSNGQGVTVRRSLFLDYPPFTKILYKLISGDWTSQGTLNDHIVPGRVPWEVFGFEDSREVLSNVDWTIQLESDKRDQAWDALDTLDNVKASVPLISQSDAEGAAALETPPLQGKITDAETGQPLSARIVLRDAQGLPLNSYYSNFPGFFTETDGTFTLPIKPGNYTYEVTKGFDFDRANGELTVTAGEAPILDVALKPWVKLTDLGWFNGDAHAHVVSSRSQDAEMIKDVHKVAQAQGLDFLYVVQSWAGYNETNWAAPLQFGSDEKFKLFFGAEMPKQRFGHTWWIGINDTCGYYNYGMDSGYSQYYRSTNTLLTEEEYPLVQMPSMEVVPRLRQAKNAIAVHAHPTSWWWQGGDGKQFITNIAADLVPDLLSGQLWDGLVVMGYDHDHYFYQNLWFYVLNMGYRIPPFAELDGGYAKVDPNYYGSMRTYFHLDGPFSVPNLVEAVKKGHTFVTSGPILLASVDDTYQVGDIVPLDGSTRHLKIEAYASGEFPDFISFVVVFRNGKVHKVWDDRAEKPRQVTHTLDIDEKDKSWFVVKAYGSHTWDDLSQLDVMAMSLKAETDASVPIPKHGSHDVAITSPFYFWPEGTEPPQALVSHVNLNLVNEQGESIPKANVKIILLGKEIAQYPVKEGKASFDMPVNAWVEVTTPEGTTIHRSLFVDYEPYTKVLYPLISGTWTQTQGLKGVIQPGRVPEWAFSFDEAKKVLSDVSWTIPVVENARDAEWSKLAMLNCGS